MNLDYAMENGPCGLLAMQAITGYSLDYIWQHAKNRFTTGLTSIQMLEIMCEMGWKFYDFPVDLYICPETHTVRGGQTFREYIETLKGYASHDDLRMLIVLRVPELGFHAVSYIEGLCNDDEDALLSCEVIWATAFFP